jgi:hypothetical protein
MDIFGEGFVYHFSLSGQGHIQTEEEADNGATQQ